MVAGRHGVIGTNAAWLVVVVHRSVLAHAQILPQPMEEKRVQVWRTWLRTAMMIFCVQVRTSLATKRDKTFWKCCFVSREYWKNGNDWKVLNCSFFKWMGAGHHGETGTNAVLLAEMEHKSVHAHAPIHLQHMGEKGVQVRRKWLRIVTMTFSVQVRKFLQGGSGTTSIFHEKILLRI